MDPISIVQNINSVVQFIINAAEKVSQNQEECSLLVTHVRDVLKLIQPGDEHVFLDLVPRLATLESSLVQLLDTLEELSRKPLLQRILWKDDVASRIAKAYRMLSDAVEKFELGTKIDICRFQHENEHARRLDAEHNQQALEKVLRNDREILDVLEIQRADMQEAMMSMHKRLIHLESSIERTFLQKGMYAMQRRSGPMRMVPDVFVITSFDVIIHYDRRLGAGGFGKVYRGDWQGQLVAVKVMEKGVPESILQKEIDVWKRLRHPNILEFYGACSLADPPFAVCALKANGDAMAYMQNNPDANRIKLLHETSLGLAYLHQNSVVHGDVKAMNILVDQNGCACLSDFGLSKFKMFSSTIAKTAADKSPQGTVRWMAPEHMSRGVMNKRTDIYSFGMTMYEIFTGCPPFAHVLDMAVFTLVVDRHERPMRPDDSEVIGYGLDDPMWALIEECWAQEPDQRTTCELLVSRLRTRASAPPEIPQAPVVICHEPEQQLESSDSRNEKYLEATSLSSSPPEWSGPPRYELENPNPPAYEPVVLPESGISHSTGPNETDPYRKVPVRSEPVVLPESSTSHSTGLNETDPVSYRKAPVRKDTGDNLWSINVTEPMFNSGVYYLHIKTRDCTLARTASEIVVLHHALHTLPGVELPALPFDSFRETSSLTTPGPQRTPSLVDRLSRLASRSGASDGRGRTASTRGRTPRHSRSRERNGKPDSKSTITALTAYLNTIITQPTIYQSRAWQNFVQLRKHDQHGRFKISELQNLSPTDDTAFGSLRL